MNRTEDILVIAPEGLKTLLGALAEIQALRARRPDARLTALAPLPLFDFACRSGCFDDVAAFEGWYGPLLQFRQRRFSCVYDLRGGGNLRQSLFRQSLFRRFFRGRPAWETALSAADVSAAKPDIACLTARVNEEDVISAFGLQRPYVLLLAGASKRHPERDWPRHYWSSGRFTALALKLWREGFQPVMIGTEDDAGAAEKLLCVCPAARDLCGLTSLSDVVALARGAAGAIGNDTGATHLVALTDCPTQVIDARISVHAAYRDFLPRQEEDHAAYRA